MNHSNQVRLSTTELPPTVLEGATIYGVDDQKVGKVDHIRPADALCSLSEFVASMIRDISRFE